MQAEIIAVGAELLGPGRLDTNSLFLARELNALGIHLARKAVVGDDVAAIADAVRQSCARVPLVLLSGGLGPTEDDRTREAVAAALDLGEAVDPGLENTLRDYFAARRRAMPANNLRQASLIAGATPLPNLVGSAPGQWCPTGIAGGVVILLPGPPAELEPMFAREVAPRLASLAPPRAYFTRVLGIAGRAESDVDAIAAPIYTRHTNPATTILATAGLQIELRFCATGNTAAQAQVRADSVAAEVATALGTAVFSQEGGSLAAAVATLLMRRKLTLGLAESCTGGMLAAQLTDLPGASAFFRGGVVCYSNDVKAATLAVPGRLLRDHGAVSAPVAAALARGAQTCCGAQLGLAITGIAGPGGGSPMKPVGTVFIALARPGHPDYVAHLQLAGDRDRIRRWSVMHALNLLRLHLTTPPTA